MRGLRPALSTFIFLLLITGGVYPLLTTVLGQWWFPWQANGSLIREGDTVRGSALIGQNFTGNGYFQGRPSATAEMPYNPQASGGSNLAVSNPELDKQIAARVAALRAANPDASTNVPVELVTASASGLDNNITPQAAVWQIPRVAKARNLSVEQLTQLIAKYSQQPLVKYIGLPERYLPFPTDENPDTLMEEVWESGNFGFYDERKAARPEGKWKNKWYTVKQIGRKAKLFYLYAPGETFWWPVLLSGVRIKELIQGK